MMNIMGSGGGMNPVCKMATMSSTQSTQSKPTLSTAEGILTLTSVTISTMTLPTGRPCKGARWTTGQVVLNYYELYDPKSQKIEPSERLRLPPLQGGMP